MVGTFGKNVALPADFGNAIRPQSQLEKITYALTVGGPQPTSYLAVVLGLGLTRTREILASLVKDGVIEPIASDADASTVLPSIPAHDAFRFSGLDWIESQTRLGKS